MPSSHPLPQSLPGFEAIQRYWDAKRNIAMAKVQPGEFYVTTQDEAISTVLGSCVSACIRDIDLGVGGLNHFMLPLKSAIHEKPTITSDAARYGHWAMEYLINHILEAGGRRRNLEVKIFGGGNVLRSFSSNVAELNIQFVLDYIYNENLALKAKDVGGNEARIIVYYPKAGRVLVKYLEDAAKYEIAMQERQYLQSIDTRLHGGDIELF